ncbi:hypothetical protein U9M48_038371 [Paspalum notatum var. saurae]|uniref:Protein kinase domain-containing protein n=1 Tax=Paspalum notatum var. saurae TaxID=547442 RepID=A0AAQ3UH46_PASNO
MDKVARGVTLAFAAVVAMLLQLPPFGFGIVAPAAAATGTGAGSKYCTRRCGDISIPYPFGVEQGCFHTAGGFNLTCDRSYRPPKLFLGDGTVPVLEISISDATVRINSSGLNFTHDARAGHTTMNKTWGLGLPQGGPYFLLPFYNTLWVISCNVQVDLSWGGKYNNSNQVIASCTAICPSMGPDGPYLAGDPSCEGIGCCKASIDLGYSNYNIQIHMRDSIRYDDFLGYSVYIVDQGMNFTEWKWDGSVPPKAAPALLSWMIAAGNKTCHRNASAPECISTNSHCTDIHDYGEYNGYVCDCSPGYQGNPYIRDGCKDVDECTGPSGNPCYGECVNTPGSYFCRCLSGHTGNASIPNGCTDIDECQNPEAYSCYGTCLNIPGAFHCLCPNGTYGNPSTKGACILVNKSSAGLSIGLGVGGGIISLLLLALGTPFIAHKIKLQKVRRMREKSFHQNHGLLLQKLVSHNTDIGERMIITLRDLEKATNNFDTARVIGGGGHGTVFKGIIDLKVVAIKKSRIVVEREIGEFINEVVVLSQVNHRNVVKLLGCCLETEVPLLVYEFISNGTLYQHLHVEGPIALLWVDRIRIALEIARALSYLHSAASMPIFHRDIKSTNVLLDDSLTAKVSDFGASRYIPIDQTGVTTEVQGTRGYLDPMYYYTGRLTDKSDVFSFGVLLIELVTRKQPFVYRSEQGDNLVSHFIKMLAIGNLVGIIDPQVMEEEDGEVQDVATLAAMCTKLKGEDRPTMREVEMMLESILVKKKQVPCIATRRDEEEDKALVHYMSIERGTNAAGSQHTMKDVNFRETSRQYTMEEEILLSASYPR